MSSTTEPTPPNYTVSLVLGLGLLGISLIGCIGTGIAAAIMRERDAVLVSYCGVPLAVGGLVGAIVAFFVRAKERPVALGAPVGCGCGSAILTLALVLVFYVAIWPSL